MKALVFTLIALSFLQSTVIPLDLVLIVLVLRSYQKPQKINLLLAFGFGLFISHLQNSPLGVNSLIYLMLVQVAHLAARSPFSQHLISIVILTSTVYALKTAALSLVLGQSIHLFTEVLVAGVISLPVYILVRFWEERFVVRDIKLKV